MPRVSVIIPAFNAEAFIDETVQSVLAQTYRDVELIVVDDGSTDGTLDRLAAYRNRIAIVRQTNAGVAAARNAGAARSTGEWLAFLDADDVWLPRKLECQVKAGNAALVYTNRYNIGARGELPTIQSDVTSMREGDVFMALLLEGNFITASSAMVRRDTFERMGGFYEGLAGTEDWDLWLRIAERHPVGCCHEPLVCYRFHTGGASRDDHRMRDQRALVIARALARERGLNLDWRTKRRIWANTWMTTGWDACRSGSRRRALIDYGRAAIAWPLSLRTYKEALKLCLP